MGWAWEWSTETGASQTEAAAIFTVGRGAANSSLAVQAPVLSGRFYGRTHEPADRDFLHQRLPPPCPEHMARGGELLHQSRMAEEEEHRIRGTVRGLAHALTRCRRNAGTSLPGANVGEQGDQRRGG